MLFQNFVKYVQLKVGRIEVHCAIVLWRS